MTKDELVESVNFIFMECHRLQEQMSKDFKSLRKKDIFYSLPHPNGRGGLMLCGIKAYQEMEKLASHAALRSGIQRRVTTETVREQLEKILVERFLVELLPINIKQIDRALNAASKDAAKKCEDRIHLVPCHLMTAQEPSELSIGPVSFANRKIFRRLMREKLKEEKAKKSRSDDRKLIRGLLFDSMTYYRSFDWVAKVEIKGCDEKQADKLAKRAVTAALDCIHLVLGGDHTDKMKVGGPQMSRDRRAKLVLSADGEFHPTITWGGRGQVGFRDGWSHLLHRDEVQRILELCGVALEAAVNPDLERPFSRRFLDATLWFGQAVREESPAASVVKFVTALERMLMTEERKDISQLLAERLSAICVLGYEGQNYKTRQQWFKETKKAYNLRSKLVHGSMSPEAPEVTAGVHSCMKLTEAASLCFLSLLGKESLRENKVNSNQLVSMFDSMIAQADKIGSS